MSFEIGDEVRYNRTGEFGIITEIDEINKIYTVEIEDDVGTQYEAKESELS